jgi:putative inorganic carbon (hco3(-)) transporter
MGFTLTVIYVVLAILSPDQFGSNLASLHVLTFVAVASALASLPQVLSNSHALFCKQTLLLFGFILAIGLSRAVNGWAGGALASWTLFLPSTIVFFLIILSVTTPRRLKILALAVVGSCLVVAIEGLCGYYGGFRGDAFVVQRDVFQGDQIVGHFGQIRGVGFLNDPNDFSQMLVIALPLAFLAWRRGSALRNTLLVYVPLGLMLWAIFLTHSRGALMGLAVLVLLAIRKRIPTSASLVLVTLFVVGMLALNFSGGRGISIADGGDRLEAWSNGMEMFKQAPIFGLGFSAFNDFNDITAHNSLVLVLAELGLIGSTLWMAMLVSTTVSLNKIIGLHKTVTEGDDNDHTKALEQPDNEAEAVLVPAYLAATLSKGSNPVMALHQLDDGAEAVLSAPAGWAETVGDGSEHPDDEVEPVLSVPVGWTETTVDGSERAVAPQQQFNDEAENVSSIPTYWTETIRLGLIGFMTTGWFLSRCYSATLYLILGLATATIILQLPPSEDQDNAQWVLLTLIAESVAIVLIYAAVRLHWGAVS